jgi:hypothetical protein
MSLLLLPERKPALRLGATYGYRYRGKARSVVPRVALPRFVHGELIMLRGWVGLYPGVLCPWIVI